jgi:hypothetical protein
MGDTWRVSASIMDGKGHDVSVSFVVRSTIVTDWRWAVERAHQQLEGCTIKGPVSAGEIWLSQTERSQGPRR